MMRTAGRDVDTTCCRCRRQEGRRGEKENREQDRTQRYKAEATCTLGTGTHKKKEEVRGVQHVHVRAFPLLQGSIAHITPQHGLDSHIHHKRSKALDPGCLDKRTSKGCVDSIFIRR